MNQSNEIPSEIRMLASDPKMRQKFFEVIGRGSGSLDFGKQKINIKPAFESIGQQQDAEVEKAINVQMGQSAD